MKINISRQHIYLLGMSAFLLIFVLVFSFAVLIPKGKEILDLNNPEMIVDWLLKNGKIV